MQDRTLQLFLKQLGLNAGERAIYLHLVTRGTLSTLDLSRLTSIPRTTIYRLLEHLKSLGLVEEVIDEHRTLARATSPEQLELLLKQKQTQLQFLEEKFPLVSRYLTAANNPEDPTTRVVFYRGAAGIKQMVWNVLRAKKEGVGFSYRLLEEIVGKKLAREFYDEFCQKNLLFRDLFSDHYLESLRQNQTEDAFHTPHFISRYLPASILDIDIQVDVYNDVFTLYNWYEGEVFGIEIYNAKIANFQKQVFEILWQQAQPVPQI